MRPANVAIFFAQKIKYAAVNIQALLSVCVSRPLSTIRSMVFRDEDRNQPRASEIAEWISPTLAAPDAQSVFRIARSEEDGFVAALVACVIKGHDAVWLD